MQLEISQLCITAKPRRDLELVLNYRSQAFYLGWKQSRVYSAM